MPNPVFPKGLRPVQSGYGHDEPGGARRTAVAGGVARYALAYDRGVQRFTVTVALNNDTRRAIWTLFYLRVIKQGTITFDMPLDSGFGVQTHASNIVPGSYATSVVGGKLWTVKFTVEATSKAFDFSDEYVQAALDSYEIYGDELPASLARLAQFVLVDSLVLDF